MRFPGIIEYLNSFSSGDDCFSSLMGVRLDSDVDGHATYRSGNFGVVFKAQTCDGPRALKCFTRDQVGRQGAYAKISGGLPRSKYLVDYQFLASEILVSISGDVLTCFPVLNMEWACGQTMGCVIDRAVAVGDVACLESLSLSFDNMAQWLLSQDFAHGDLKPDNIIVGETGELRLVDYDGIFMPSMRGEMQREVGTDAFQHPLRSSMPFGKSIDDYSIATLSLTLRALSFEPELYSRFGPCSPLWSGGLLFDPAQAVSGESVLLNFLHDTSLGSLALMDCICSATPSIEGLSAALADRPFFDKIELFDVLFPARQDNKWGFADNTGVMKIAPIYDRVHEFSCDRAAVCIAGLWGYVDIHGRAMCAIKFDNVWSFTPEGLALVRRGDKYGFVGVDCRMAIAARYDFAAPFADGLAVASIDNRYGYIDIRGRWAIKAQYSYAESFHDGRAAVEIGSQKMFINQPLQ